MLKEVVRRKTAVIRLGRAVKADNLGFDLRALGGYDRVWS